MKRTSIVVATLVSLMLSSLSPALTGDQAQAQRYRRGNWNRNAMVPAGTSFDVRLDSKISTEDARAGDPWSGTISQSVVSGDRILIPAGTPVSGVVTSAAQGTHETQAQIDLAVRDVVVNGRTRSMNANTEPIIADSKRAKKLGAIAGGAAAGALIGHAVAKDNHGTLIGGLLGGLTGYGATRHAFRTLQLKPGTVVTFTTNEDVAMRR